MRNKYHKKIDINIDNNQFKSIMGFKKYTMRIIWVLISIICITSICIILTHNSEYEQHQCDISYIDYPTSFNVSAGGWKDCTCGTKFCTGICYCVKMFSPIKKGYILQNFAGLDGDPECTFKNIIIPFDLNFQPIISTYLNKTVDCWYKPDMENIYVNHELLTNNHGGILILSLILLIGTNIICLYIEINKRNHNHESDKIIHDMNFEYNMYQEYNNMNQEYN